MTRYEFLRNIGRAQRVILRSYGRGRLKGDSPMLVCDVHTKSNQICLTDEYGLYVFEVLEESTNGEIFVSSSEFTYKLILEEEFNNE